jgi:hypothetical protein
MSFDKHTDAQAMGFILDDVRDKVIVFIAVRFPEFPQNVDASEEHFSLSPAEPKMIVPWMYGPAVSKNLDDGKSVEGVFL